LIYSKRKTLHYIVYISCEGGERKKTKEGKKDHARKTIHYKNLERREELNITGGYLQAMYEHNLPNQRISLRTKPDGTCKRKLVNPNSGAEKIDKRRKRGWRISALPGHGPAVDRG